MNYPETLHYLYSRLPMFSSHGKGAIKPGLQNTIKFCQELENPHQKFKSVHVGGTNGKGSTSHMLAAILQKAGYKTGLYTSPHLRDFRERIRINGEMIAEMEVIQFVEANQQYIEDLEPSFFEVTVALAFEYFAQNQVDIAIIEVGLGGRLDSTNVIHPELSVISNIGYDHMDILGNTLNEIASEKAGIIKQNVPVVISQRQNEVEDIFINKAFEMNSGLTFGSDEWDISRSQTQNNSSGLLKLEIRQKTNSDNPIFSFDSLELDLTGSYQLKNLAGVLSAIKHLRVKGYQIDDQDIRFALRQVKKLTGLMGRWHTLNYNPQIICDTGHNEDGIKEVLKNIHLTPHKDLHMVIGMVKDKDITKILSLLPQKAFYYFCQPNIPRAKPANDLQLEASKYGLNGSFYPTVQAAFDEAKKNAGKNDLIFIGGSTFVVAEII
jgi:dihydrofolate synthase/folylpolyglutamate synthase